MVLQHVLAGDDGAEDLLVMLHGYGDDPHHILRIVTRLDFEGRFKVIAPQGPNKTDEGFSWFGHTAYGTPDLGDVTAGVAAIDELIDEVGRPEGSLAVVGFSQGGAMAMSHSIMTASPLPSAVVSICGYLPELDEVDLSSVSGVDFLLQAGSNDETVPAEFIEMGADTLAAHGAKAVYQAHEMGHTSTAESAVAAGRWLASVLGPAPF